MMIFHILYNDCQVGMWENTFIWFTSDNGGPLPTANNYPLRGGKFTDWVRVASLFG